MRIAEFMKWSIWSAVVLTSVAWPHAQGTKPAPSAPGQQTAAQFYVEYRAAFDKATKLEEILPFRTAEKRKEAEAMPAMVRDLGLQAASARARGRRAP